MERQSTSRRGNPARARVRRTFRELGDAPNLDRVGQQEPHEAGNFYAKRRGREGVPAVDSKVVGRRVIWGKAEGRWVCEKIIRPIPNPFVPSSAHLFRARIEGRQAADLPSKLPLDTRPERTAATRG